MNGTNQRLMDDTDQDQEGDFPSFEFDWHVHLVAFDQNVSADIEPAGELNPQIADFRKLPRLLARPSGEMIDNRAALSGPFIAQRYTGEGVSVVIDEISGDGGETRFRLTLSDERLSSQGTTIRVISSEGVPDDADVPVGPGVLKIGDELVVFQEAEISGGALVFSQCVRGVLRTQAVGYERGVEVVPQVGFYVAILTESVQASSNALSGLGFDRFPLDGCLRLEDPDSDRAELRIYTTNDGATVSMPVHTFGGGIFTSRYGTVATSHDQGTQIGRASCRERV